MFYCIAYKKSKWSDLCLSPQLEFNVHINEHSRWLSTDASRRSDRRFGVCCIMTCRSIHISQPSSSIFIHQHALWFNPVKPGIGNNSQKNATVYWSAMFLLSIILCSCGSVGIEHCVSSAKGRGFNSQGTHYW